MAGREATQDALFAAIKDNVEAVQASNMQKPSKVALIQQLALAYRLTSGGAQPGSSILER